MTEVVLKVEMTCSGCSGAVERVLTRSKDKGEGIEEFVVDLEGQKVTIKLKEGSELSEETLIEKVRDVARHTPCTRSPSFSFERRLARRARRQSYGLNKKNRLLTLRIGTRVSSEAPR